MAYEYDEEASAVWHMDVVHEYDETPLTIERWQESRRRLNKITDPLSRKILALHEKCGTGDGECDSDGECDFPGLPFWPCDTISLIANHFEIEYPPVDWDAADR